MMVLLEPQPLFDEEGNLYVIPKIENEMSDFEEVTIDGAPSEIYLCEPCQIYFPTQETLDDHVQRTHNEEKKRTSGIIAKLREEASGYRTGKYGSYICNHCGYTALAKSAISLHMVDRHSDKFKTLAYHTSSITVAIENAVIPDEPEEEFETLVEDMENYDENSDNFDDNDENDYDENFEDMDEYESEDAGRRVDKMYNCPYCSFTATQRATMNAHVNNKHDDELRESIARGEAMRRIHENNPNSDKLEYFCTYCTFGATSRATLNAHTRRKHPGYLQPMASRKQPVIELDCDLCDYKTTDKRKMQIHHERKHVTEYRYTCEYCGKKFKVKCDLTAHIRFQHFKTPTVCDVCGKICSNNNALHVHQKREHFKPDYECHICKRRMVSQENLDEHIVKQHEQRTKCVCELCGKTFDQPNKLKQHARTHTGERPHMCHLCGKAFARRAVYRQHLLIHTGQRPYICDICGKSFTQKPGLICHRKMHPGDKPPLPVVYIDHILKKFVKDN